jgi:membrane associated rhomboid family serine protease
MKPMVVVRPQACNKAGMSASEFSAFQNAILERRPVATVVLVVLICAIYGVELWVGGPDYPPALLRLGALQRDSVLQGELWRLVSAAFLHGSLVHLAMNMYVLWGFGRALERVLGLERFLVLYGASAIGGSLLSILFLEGFSVGASGAIWGLMLAQLVLVWRGAGIFPEPIRQRISQGMTQNLVLNILISFRAGVDWAAHAGGGIMGALCTLLLVMGLPKWAKGDTRPDQVPGWVRLGARLSVGIMALGLVGAGIFGQPWKALAAPELFSVEFSGYRLMLPAELDQQPSPQEIEKVYGNFLHDPGVVDLIIAPNEEPATSEVQEATLLYLEESFSKPQDGFALKGKLERRAKNGRMLLVGSYAGPGELELERVVEVQEQAVIRVDVVYWKQAASSWSGLAEAVVLSAVPVK